MRSFVCIFILGLLSYPAKAAPFAAGGSIGMEFPFAHTQNKEAEWGLAAEGFYRLDPYEVRFHFGGRRTNYYSVVLGVKHYLSNELIRPYFEAAAGPLVVDVSGKSIAYGFSPQASAGADLAINEFLSTGLVARYMGYVYFGDTNSGSFEANHSMAILANAILWF